MKNELLFIICDLFPVIPITYIFYRKLHTRLSARLILIYFFILLLQPLLLQLLDEYPAAAKSAKYLLTAILLVVLCLFFILEIKNSYFSILLAAAGFVLFLLMMGSAFQMQFTVQPYRLLNFGLFFVSIFSIGYVFTHYNGELMYNKPVFWLSAGLLFFYGSIVLTYLFYRYMGHSVLAAAGIFYALPFIFHCILVTVAAYVSHKTLPGPKNTNRF
jgi:hypothetical protein